MNLSRAKWWLITVVSAAAFVGAVVPMARRIGEFNEHAHFRRFHAQVKISREFELVGFPAVKLTDATDGAGASFLKLEYGPVSAAPGAPPGATVVMIPVRKPPAPNMPDLGIYDEWLKVLAINEVETAASGNSTAKPGTERLMIVSRLTPTGFDPDSWGSVRRIEWMFDFYILNPDGTVDSFIKRWPRSASAERAIAGEAADPLNKIPPLEARSLELFAAMHVIPKLNVPKYKFTDTALSPRVLGWTLPVSALSFLLMTGALCAAIAPRGKSDALRRELVRDPTSAPSPDGGRGGR